MQKIENGNEPYVDERNPEYEDVTEPAFLEEWQDANEAVEIVGQWCLTMIHGSLKAFLEEYVDEMAREYRNAFTDAKQRLANTKGKGWFDRYRLFFLAEFNIDWKHCPVKIADLEQINLTRDDLIHNISVTTTVVYQTKKHAERFPKSLFTDDVWAGLGLGGRIKVERDQLTKALQLVDEFCTWLEDIQVNVSSGSRFGDPTPRRQLT